MSVPQGCAKLLFFPIKKIMPSSAAWGKTSLISLGSKTNGPAELFNVNQKWNCSKNVLNFKAVGRQVLNDFLAGWVVPRIIVEAKICQTTICRTKINQNFIDFIDLT